MERQPRMSTSSISFRETPELNSTPPAAAGNQFAHAVRNVPTPPGILSSSPTASPARGRGVVVAAGASGAGGLGDGGVHPFALFRLRPHWPALRAQIHIHFLSRCRRQ
eukprot:COSAG02_NODE_10388_length_1951_cov_38.191685_2_plen_108_part_00